MKMSWRGMRTSAILLLAFFLISGFSLSFVTAQPAVQSVSVTKNGDHTILTLEIKQESSAFEDEVDSVAAVAVRLDGGEPIIQNVTSTSVDVITVEIDLGVLEGTPKAELSILTTSSGWTPWFEPFEVPEFTLAQMMLFFLALTLSVALLKLRKKLLYK